MNEQAESGADERAAGANLPYVDGRATSSAQLRAEVAKESDPRVQHIQEARDELAAIVDEIGQRFDVRSWVPRIWPRAGAWVAAAAGVLALVVLRRRWTHPTGRRRGSPT